MEKQTCKFLRFVMNTPTTNKHNYVLLRPMHWACVERSPEH